VPSYGLYYLDHTFDFICPAAKTVGEVAQALEVIAGTDPRDPQWVRGPIITDDYTKHLVPDVSGMTIGVLKEGFGWPQSEPDVDEAVMAAVKQLEARGAKVKEVSAPLWLDNWAIWQNVFFPSISLMLESNGQGFFHNGYATPTFAKAFGDKRRLWADEQPPLLKTVQLLGMYLRRYQNNVHYAKAQNLRKVLTQQVDAALDEADLLVVPGVIVKPTKLFPFPLTPTEWIAGEVPVVAGTATAAPVANNTAATDITGHPSLVMPCGAGGEDNMPISIMFIGKHWHEGTVFRAAHTYETMILDLYQQLDQQAKAVMASL
jgi:amidase